MTQIDTDGMSDRSSLSLPMDALLSTLFHSSQRGQSRIRLIAIGAPEDVL